MLNGFPQKFKSLKILGAKQKNLMSAFNMLTWFGTYVSKSFYSSCRSHWTFSLSSAVGLCRLTTIWSGISTPYRCCGIQWTDCPFKAIGMYYIAVLYTTIVVVKPLQGVVINVYGCWKGKLLMPAFLILLTIQALCTWSPHVNVSFIHPSLVVACRPCVLSWGPSFRRS